MAWNCTHCESASPWWPVFLGLLYSNNCCWAEKAGALVLLVSKKTLDRDGTHCRSHSFDAGAAWQNLALQATLLGLAVRAMQGFDRERARRELSIPDEFEVEYMITVGHPADPATLPPELRDRERPNARRPVAETAFEGPFGGSLAGS